MKILREIFINVNTVKFSLCGKFLAFGSSNELSVVRTFDGIMLLKVYCSGKIKCVEWSVDSDHVLCVIGSRKSVELFSVSSPEWTCVIREGPLGLLTAAWSPRGCHVLTVAEFGVRLSVWSLAGRSVAFIETPLIKYEDKLCFSEDGNHLALVSGNFGNFQISVFSTVSWTTTSRISCTNKICIPSIPLWSHDDVHVAVWETVDYENSVLEIYDVKAGKKRGHFSLKRKNKPGGIASVVWCQNGQCLMIGCRDDCIYVLNHITWSVLTVFNHERVIDNSACDIYRGTTRAGHLKFFILRERPAKFTFVSPSTRTGEKLTGVKNISVSNDGVHVASQSQHLPAVVWIWNLTTLSLMTVIVIKNRVTDLAWCDSNLSLIICDGSDGVTLWRPHKMPETHLISSVLNHRQKIKKCLCRPHATGGATDALFLTSASMLIVSNFHTLNCF